MIPVHYCFEQFITILSEANLAVLLSELQQTFWIALHISRNDDSVEIFSQLSNTVWDSGILYFDFDS